MFGSIFPFLVQLDIIELQEMNENNTTKNALFPGTHAWVFSCINKHIDSSTMAQPKALLALEQPLTGWRLNCRGIIKQEH